jgi:hypothetical protein
MGLIHEIGHAQTIGISDHFEYLLDGVFEEYEKKARSYGFKVGMEVDGSKWVDEALGLSNDYFVYHCRDSQREYKGLEKLLLTNKPVIIAHPFTMETDLKQVPVDCFIEINNRYIWRHDWRRRIPEITGERKYVISSDAHQPNWINQNVARYVCSEMNIKETLLFPSVASSTMTTP